MYNNHSLLWKSNGLGLCPVLLRYVPKMKYNFTEKLLVVSFLYVVSDGVTSYEYALVDLHTYAKLKVNMLMNLKNRKINERFSFSMVIFHVIFVIIFLLMVL